MKPSDVPNLNPEALSKALAVGSSVSNTWHAYEFRSVLQFQMDAPLALDLASGDEALRTELDHLIGESDPAPMTLKDLLFHPRPSVSLLIRVKNFAKAMRSDPRRRLPPEVATAIYFAAIAAAKSKCDTTITELDDAALKAVGGWVDSQEWIDEPLRRLMITGLPA